MFSPTEFVTLLEDLGITHVVWIPDSTFGPWEAALETSQVTLVRVCREGEAWPLAAGLRIAGQSPLIVIQSTGFFESADAMRNVLLDMKVPVYALVGARNRLTADSPDSAKHAIEPVVAAWQLDAVWIEQVQDIASLRDHYRQCRETGTPGVALIAEGAG